MYTFSRIFENWQFRGVIFLFLILLPLCSIIKVIFTVYIFSRTFDKRENMYVHSTYISSAKNISVAKLVNSNKVRHRRTSTFVTGLLQLSSTKIGRNYSAQRASLIGMNGFRFRTSSAFCS